MGKERVGNEIVHSGIGWASQGSGEIQSRKEEVCTSAGSTLKVRGDGIVVFHALGLPMCIGFSLKFYIFPERGEGGKQRE